MGGNISCSLPFWILKLTLEANSSDQNEELMLSASDFEGLLSKLKIFLAESVTSGCGLKT